jgi:hypothetical protein
MNNFIHLESRKTQKVINLILICKINLVKKTHVILINIEFENKNPKIQDS